MTSTERLAAPIGGFTFVAPSQDACEGDSCLLPGALAPGEDAASGSEESLVTPPR